MNSGRGWRDSTPLRPICLSRFTRLRQDAPCGSSGRIGLRRRLRPDKMATGDRGVARRAKTGGFGAVPLGFATGAPRGSAGSFTPSITRTHSNDMLF